jgi:hypothetical protein
MCKYNIGEVVIAVVPYSDGSGVKKRPCIILNTKKLIQDCNYFLLECNSFKSKHYDSNVLKITKQHAEFETLGFTEDTIITKNKCWLPEKMLTKFAGNPIGKCNFINQLI